jgi:alpha-galactosidase
MNSRTRTTARRLLSAAATSALTAALCAVVVVSTEAPAAAKDDGLARTPPMGFNNWNDTGCGSGFNEAYVKSMADLMVSTGLRDAGYEYLNLDDCWARPQNSAEGSRDADGHLVPDPVRFPNDIDTVADYVHDQGLKFGIYSDRGTRTCNGQGFDGALGAGWEPGDPTYEFIDAQDFADWGVDYLKFDNCNNQGLNAEERYTKMRDALEATGRDIVFSICEWGQNQPWLWGSDVGHLWRTTGDISANYTSMSNIAKHNLTLAQYAGPGHWNDPDMLQVGNGSWSLTEQRTHFSLWSIMAAPLLIGTDLRDATPQTMDILLNKEAIAVDQDPLGIQGDLVRPATDGHYVIAKPLDNGDVAVALWNDSTTPARISTTAGEIGLPVRGGYTVRDLWDHSNRSTSGVIAATVPAHGTALYRVSVDPDWEDYPPSVSFDVSADAPAVGSVGQVVVPGRQVDVTAALVNDGRTPVELPEVGVDGPTSYEGVGYEAESATSTRSGAARISSCSGCSGGQKVGFIGNGPDNWVRLNDVTATSAGSYQLTIHAAVSGTRSLFVSVNDAAGVEVPVTGTSFSSPVAVTIPVTLAAGSNSIRFYNDTAFGPDLDRIVVTGTASLDGWTMSPTGTITRDTLVGGKRLSGTWQVTPPEDAAPGTYELMASGTYSFGGTTYDVGAPIRLVVLSTPPLVTGQLSDQRWVDAQNAWGPVEIDMSNGERSAGDGDPITIGGVEYAKGLGVHAPSDILYYANGRCSEVTADVGVDDEVGNDPGSVTFEIWADGDRVADSGVLTSQDPAKPITADISGAGFVQLTVTDAGDGINDDHADWADARVECG